MVVSSISLHPFTKVERTGELILTSYPTWHQHKERSMSNRFRFLNSRPSSGSLVHFLGVEYHRRVVCKSRKRVPPGNLRTGRNIYVLGRFLINLPLPFVTVLCIYWGFLFLNIILSQWCGGGVVVEPNLSVRYFFMSSSNMISILLFFLLLFWYLIF